MSSLVWLNYFDSGKPFHPLVINYAAQLLSIMDLGLRGVVLSAPEGSRRLSDADASWLTATGLDPDDLPGINKLLGPLQLRQTGTSGTLDIRRESLAMEVVGSPKYHAHYFQLASSAVLILAWELTADYHPKGRDNGPLWEFLFHCRNAAAHGGRFRFRKKEPEKAASWRGLEITRSLQGQPLFARENHPGLLQIGDPIPLLWDIEQAYPNLMVKVQV